MEIKVRLFATLRIGRAKELMLSLSEQTCPQQIIELLAIDTADVAILLINGRDGLMSTPLKLGDVVSIFPPVGGG